MKGLASTGGFEDSQTLRGPFRLLILRSFAGARGDCLFEHEIGALMKPTAPNSSGRQISGRCLCGAVELQIDFPAFWASHDHSAASRRAHGAAYATYIGCWRKHARVVKGRKSIARFEDIKTDSSSAILRSYSATCTASASSSLNSPSSYFGSTAESDCATGCSAAPVHAAPRSRRETHAPPAA
jgi:hypothetical protein